MILGILWEERWEEGGREETEATVSAKVQYISQGLTYLLKTNLSDNGVSEF